MFQVIADKGGCKHSTYYNGTDCFVCPLRDYCFNPYKPYGRRDEERQKIAYNYLLLSLKKEDIPEEIEYIMFETLL